MRKDEKDIIKTFDDMPLVLNVEDIAKIMSISKNTAYKLIKSKEFSSMKIGKNIVVPKQAFERWLNKCERNSEK